MSMRMTDVLVKWLENAEWEERPEVDEEAQTSQLSFSMHISDDFAAKAYYEISEKGGLFKVFMYFLDSKIPASKLDEVVKWANMVNIGIVLGHLVAIPDDRILRFYAAIDVENAAFEHAHIENLLNAGIRTMKYRLPQFMAICFGGKTAEEALEIEPEE